MWGYAIGYIEEYEKYKGGVRGTNNDFPLGKKYWFKPNIIWDIYRDKVLNKREIFNCMTSDVKSHEQLKQKMVSKYPSKKTSIITIFNNHGF